MSSFPGAASLWADFESLLCRADPKPTLPEQLPKPPVRAHNPLNQSFKVTTILVHHHLQKVYRRPIQIGELYGEGSIIRDCNRAGCVPHARYFVPTDAV